MRIKERVTECGEMLRGYGVAKNYRSVIGMSRMLKYVTWCSGVLRMLRVLRVLRCYGLGGNYQSLRDQRTALSFLRSATESPR